MRLPLQSTPNIVADAALVLEAASLRKPSFTVKIALVPESVHLKDIPPAIDSFTSFTGGGSLV